MNEYEKNLVENNLSAVKSVVNGLIYSGRINQSEYDDYFQYGCLMLCEKAGKYDGRVKFSTFAETVLKNAFVDLYRKNKNSVSGDVSLSEELSDDGALLEEFLKSKLDTEKEVLSAVLEKDIKQMISEAKRKCKTPTTVKGFEALELKISGMTGSEIAKLYNVPANSVRSWISRAKKILLADEKFVALF
ncbi:MAG: sigma-70 family RNA polymerase sigma factor [Clostridia bacterium]|nr:sigma-70 family RNA polymerase sigma factor [Clostridia bacterium]